MTVVKGSLFLYHVVFFKARSIRAPLDSCSTVFEFNLTINSLNLILTQTPILIIDPSPLTLTNNPNLTPTLTVT